MTADNSRAWWLAHKAEYEQAVREPMDALLAELAEFGPFHVFRPNRDVRFAKDKTPYKDHIGAYGEAEGGTGYYVQFSATGMFAGSGYYHMAGDQLERFRTAVDDDVLGPRIATIVDGARTRRVQGQRRRCAEDGAARLRQGPPAHRPAAPQGIRRHPGVAGRPSGCRRRQSSAACATRGPPAAAMNEWLDAHVGPSTLPPDEGPGWRR